MGQIKEALYTNSEKFSKKYGYIFTSLYLYEFQQQCKSNVKLQNIEDPIVCNELSKEIINHTLFNYFEELLKDSDINIHLIDSEMLYDLCELYDY